MDEDGRPIIFFDGYCGLCNRSVDFVLRRDREHRFRFTPLQGLTAARELSETPPEELIHSFWLKDRAGLHKKSAAWLRVCQGLGGLMPLLYALILVPRPVRDWFYDLVARHRYKIWGRRDTCRTPTPEERPYFLP